METATESAANRGALHLRVHPPHPLRLERATATLRIRQCVSLRRRLTWTAATSHIGGSKCYRRTHTVSTETRTESGVNGDLCRVRSAHKWGAAISLAAVITLLGMIASACGYFSPSPTANQDAPRRAIAAAVPTPSKPILEGEFPGIALHRCPQSTTQLTSYPCQARRTMRPQQRLTASYSGSASRPPLLHRPNPWWHFPVNQQHAQVRCPGAKASDHVGEQVTVLGRVTATSYMGDPSLPSGWPRTTITFSLGWFSHFDLWILDIDLPNFATEPDIQYRGKIVCVDGLIEMNVGHPTVIVRSPRSIAVLDKSREAFACPGRNPWDEAKAYVGRWLAVGGPVIRTHSAEDSDGRPTFLNIGRDHPDQGRFQVVILGRDRGKFGTPPEAEYQGRSICVSGPIKLHQGVAEIEVATPHNIRVDGPTTRQQLGMSARRTARFAETAAPIAPPLLEPYARADGTDDRPVDVLRRR